MQTEQLLKVLNDFSPYINMVIAILGLLVAITSVMATRAIALRKERIDQPLLVLDQFKLKILPQRESINIDCILTNVGYSPARDIAIELFVHVVEEDRLIQQLKRKRSLFVNSNRIHGGYKHLLAAGAEYKINETRIGIIHSYMFKKYYKIIILARLEYRSFTSEAFIPRVYTAAYEIKRGAQSDEDYEAIPAQLPKKEIRLHSPFKR